jgi:lysozyme family protein
VLANEGGLSVNQYDSGGITKFGISQASYPHLDIKNLTIDQAKEIYKRDFWEANLYEKIQEVHLAAKVFDLSVNVGAKWANRLLQRALKSTGVTVIENGILDAQNITAINQADPTDLLAALKSEAAGYYRTLSTIHPKDSIFLRGWLKRGYG